MFRDGVRIVVKVSWIRRPGKRFRGHAVDLQNAGHVRSLEQGGHITAPPGSIGVQVLNRLGGIAGGIGCRGAQMPDPLVRDALHTGLLHPGGAGLHIGRQSARIKQVCVGRDVEQPAADQAGELRLVTRDGDEEACGSVRIHRKGVTAGVGGAADEAVGVVVPPMSRLTTPSGARIRARTENPVQMFAGGVSAPQLRIHAGGKQRAEKPERLVKWIRGPAIHLRHAGVDSGEVFGVMKLRVGHVLEPRNAYGHVRFIPRPIHGLHRLEVEVGMFPVVAQQRQGGEPTVRHGAHFGLK